MRPPESLLQDCRHPDPPEELLEAADFRSYSVASARYVFLYAAALDACNADKRALRTWYSVALPETGD